MGRKKPTAAPSGKEDAPVRYPLRKRPVINLAEDFEDPKESSKSSSTVPRERPAQKKTKSTTSVITVSSNGHTRKSRSDTSVVTVDTDVTLRQSPEVSRRRVVEDTVADVVARITEKSKEYSELKEAVGNINEKLGAVMEKMEKDSILMEENINEVKDIKKELVSQRECMGEMRAVMTEWGGVIVRAVELLERNERNTVAASDMEMITVGFNMHGTEDNLMETTKIHEEEESLSSGRLTTITEEPPSFVETTIDRTVASRRTTVSAERDSSEGTTRTLNPDESRFTVGSDITPTARPKSPSLSPIVPNSGSEAESEYSEDGFSKKKTFKRITMAPSSLANSSLNSSFDTSENDRRGSLASFLCNSQRSRGTSDTSEGLMTAVPDRRSSLPPNVLFEANCEISEQENEPRSSFETRVRRSSIDLARHILENRTNPRTTRTRSHQVPLNVNNNNTPDTSIICLGTPYRPTPPLINLVTSYNEATPRRTTTSFRPNSTLTPDNTMDLLSARESLRKTNNETVEKDILITSRRAEDLNTSTNTSESN